MSQSQLSRLRKKTVPLGFPRAARARPSATTTRNLPTGGLCLTVDKCRRKRRENESRKNIISGIVRVVIIRMQLVRQASVKWRKRKDKDKCTDMPCEIN